MFILLHSFFNMGAKSMVEDAVVKYPVVVFSKTWCPFCKRAKAALSEAGVNVNDDVKVYELDNMGSKRRSIQNYISEKYGHRTVPAVFIGGKLVGGGDETAQLQRDGKLAPMVSAAASKRSTSTAKTRSIK